MSSGPKTVTSTTNSEPPAYLQAPLRTAANAVTADYQRQVGGALQGTPYSGGTGYYGNPNIRRGGRTAFEGDFMPGIGPRDGEFQPQVNGPTPVGPGAGNNLISNSQSLVDQTISGDFLNNNPFLGGDPNNPFLGGGATNPYLDATFNRAADLTKGRLDSEFAGAGRNLGASYPARSDELQTLAANIYRPAYESDQNRRLSAYEGQQGRALNAYEGERGRQFGAVSQAESLDPLNQFINRIAGIIPQAGGVTTSQQPYFKQGLF